MTDTPVDEGREELGVSSLRADRAGGPADPSPQAVSTVPALIADAEDADTAAHRATQWRQWAIEQAVRAGSKNPVKDAKAFLAYVAGGARG